MDWPCTISYCEAIANYFKIPLYLSWKEGGFLTELLKDNQKSADTLFETPEGQILRIPSMANPNTRRRFPQQSASLKTRWCSSFLKIDVMSKVIRHQSRFNGKKTLVLTGERAEESANRAKYQIFQKHTTFSRKREVYHFRPMLHFTMEQWQIPIGATASLKSGSP